MGFLTVCYIAGGKVHAKRIPVKRKNSVWRTTSIRSIIRNPIYTSRMKTTSGLSEAFEQYRVVDDAAFQAASEMLKSRAPDASNKRHGALRVSENEHGLLIGIIYCAHCGNRTSINLFTQKRKAKNSSLHFFDREVYRRNIKVYNRLGCLRRTVHDAKKIDGIFLDLVSEFFADVKKSRRRPCCAPQ